MEKIIEFMEQKVEYFVLGIAVVFFLLMTWWYLINPPVVQKLNSNNETPGSIDATIERTSAAALADGINNPIVPPMDKIVDKSFDVNAVFNLPDAQVLAVAWPIRALDVDETRIPTPGGQGGSGAGASPPAVAIAGLPVLPAAEPLGVASGMSMAPKDITWNQVFFRVPHDALRDAWKPFANLAKSDTVFLIVKAYRSEKTDSGWSADTEVPMLPGSTLPPYPDPKNPLATNFIQYSVVAMQKAGEIVSPPMPNQPAGPAGTIMGRPAKLLLKDLLANSTTRKSGPAAFNSGITSYLAETDLPFAQRGPANGPPPGSGPPANSRGGNRNRGSQPPISGPPPGAGPNGGAPGGPPMPRQVAPPTIPAESLEPKVELVKNLHVSVMPVAPPATGTFNPTAAQADGADWLLYVLDTTAQANHTYKYRIEYKLLNPLFGAAAQQVANPAWVNQFDLTSGQSNYSPEITTMQNTYFFCASTNNTASTQSMSFEVFRWAAGQWRHHTFKVNSGDRIGNIDKDGATEVDFSTGYIYVESALASRKGISSQKFMASVVDAKTGEIIQKDEAGEAAPNAEHRKYVYYAAHPSSTGAQASALPGQPVAGGPMPGGPPPDSGSDAPEGLVPLPNGGFRPMTPEERRAHGLDDPNVPPGIN